MPRPRPLTVALVTMIVIIAFTVACSAPPGASSTPTRVPVAVPTDTPTLSPTVVPTTSPIIRTPTTNPTIAAKPTGRSKVAATPSPAASVATSSADLSFVRPWPLDAQTGWLTARQCVTPPTPAPNQSDNLPAETSPICQGVIFATSNAGVTWSRQYHGIGLASDISFVDRDHGWAIGPSHPQCLDFGCPTSLLRTTDGGATWSTAYRAPFTLEQPAFVTATDGWTLGIDCADRPAGENACAVKLLVTSDGGQGWNVTTTGMYASPASMTAVLSRPTATTAWLAVTSPRTSYLQVTHDGAKTWQPVKSPVVDGWPETVLNLDFVDTQHGWLLAGGQPSAGNQAKSLYSTSDGGQTWRLVGGGSASSVPSIKVSGKGTTAGYVSDGGLQFVSPSVGWLSLSRFGLLRTTTSGATWTPVPIPNQADGFIAYHFASAEVGWALTPRSLATTVDGGTSWHEVRLPGL